MNVSPKKLVAGKRSYPMFTANYEDLLPLIDLIKTGRLNEVEKWIADGKPLDLAEQPAKGARKKTPLQYAIDTGFHSLVETLLMAKVPVNVDARCSPMTNVLAHRRFDLVQLLCEHGYDAKTVDMREVFATWQPEIMEYLIDRGADPETGMPLAWALIDRTRTVLRVFMKYKEKYASFQEQANIALRHHCKDGNLKWVSLMLWAGADPYAPGEDHPDAKTYPGERGVTAVGYALLYEHYEIVGLKQIKIPPGGPVLDDLFHYGCKGKGLDLLAKLLKNGANPNTDENGGCPAIQRLLERFETASGFDYFLHRIDRDDSNKLFDNDSSREYLKAIHLLAIHGAKWRPTDSKEIGRVRRSLLKMVADYTVEFVWIMAKYAAADIAQIDSLLGTPTMRAHVARRSARVRDILKDWRLRIEESQEKECSTTPPVEASQSIEAHD